ncbi:MAG: hypothetical protein KKB90_06940, partial [Actinobacteria bacterium]|nr:hypothetical protein [Actinomycetota bacterium]MBU4218684.1 hypothetical protein [Actinomycetota bacterium]MBU4359291.1 hypothetical protein [Actinomycetota bacterium]MBU4392137.1 hypothetical protein [Actinomycetota bacterium]MBU4403745.1 hypothetical protein [Actinomycetota bacterium]
MRPVFFLAGAWGAGVGTAAEGGIAWEMGSPLRTVPSCDAGAVAGWGAAPVAMSSFIREASGYLAPGFLAVAPAITASRLGGTPGFRRWGGLGSSW